MFLVKINRFVLLVILTACNSNEYPQLSQIPEQKINITKESNYKIKQELNSAKQTNVKRKKILEEKEE